MHTRAKDVLSTIVLDPRNVRQTVVNVLKIILSVIAGVTQAKTDTICNLWKSRQM